MRQGGVRRALSPNCWRVSDNESRKVMSEGEGACSPLFKVRSHLPLRGKLGWMTPRVSVKTTLTNGNAPFGALVPKQGPHFFAGGSAGRSPHSPAAFLISGRPFLAVLPRRSQTSLETRRRTN